MIWIFIWKKMKKLLYSFVKIPKISLFTTVIYHYKRIIFTYNHNFHRNVLGKENMNSLQSTKGHDMLLHLIYIILSITYIIGSGWQGYIKNQSHHVCPKHLSK